MLRMLCHALFNKYGNKNVRMIELEAHKEVEKTSVSKIEYALRLVVDSS